MKKFDYEFKITVEAASLEKAEEKIEEALRTELWEGLQSGIITERK